MADTLTKDEARQRFRAVTRGRSPQHSELSLAEAKANLRAADAGLDLGPALRFVSRGQWRPALLSVVTWSATEPGRAFFAPLLLQGFEIFYLLLGMFRKTSP
jgi:hypothetical protein